MDDGDDDDTDDDDTDDDTDDDHDDDDTDDDNDHKNDSYTAAGAAPGASVPCSFSQVPVEFLKNNTATDSGLAECVAPYSRIFVSATFPGYICFGNVFPVTCVFRLGFWPPVIIV